MPPLPPRPKHLEYERRHLAPSSQRPAVNHVSAASYRLKLTNTNRKGRNHLSSAEVPSANMDEEGLNELMLSLVCGKYINHQIFNHDGLIQNKCKLYKLIHTEMYAGTSHE